MQIQKILEEKENPLFKRKEIKVIIKAEKNPSVQESEKLVSEKFKSSTENIKIKKIKGKFGRHTFLIQANVYNSEEDKLKHEPETKKEKAEKMEKAEADEVVEEKRKEESKPVLVEEKPAEEAPKVEETKEEIKEEKPAEEKIE